MSRPTWLVMPLGLALDALLGEPPSSIHPVVWIGRGVALLETRAPTEPGPAFLYGLALTGAVTGASVILGAAVTRVVERLPAPFGVLLEAWMLKTTLSVRALIAAGKQVQSSLESDDLDGARRSVTALVSRDATRLDAPKLTSAAVESLAENTADSIVAPLVYYAVGGLPAALAYRASNTLDAMIGYHGRYEHLGKAAARLDDALNLLPARLSGLLLVVGGALAGGDVPTGLEVLLRDHGLTESPNAGWPMAAMAGLLGVRLEKVGHYVLGGELPPPDVAAIDHAAEIVKTATILTLAIAFGLRWLRDTIAR